MNGVHDMGGIHGFGPIRREKTEPVFHAPWEGRVFGILQALGPHGIHDPHGLRSAIERMEPARYLASSYYERWLLVTERALLERGVLASDELDAKTGFFREHPDAPPTRKEDPQIRDRILGPVYQRQSPHREVGIGPRFSMGDPVTVRNVHPRGHTRLPRYVRGKRGVVTRIHGVHDFHDAVPEGRKDEPQPVYNVRFDARNLWGDAAESNHSLYIDMWESYLDQAL